MQSLSKKSRLKMIRNELLQKSPLTKLQRKESNTKKKKPPLTSLRNFRYTLIYKSWWNSYLFDVALKKTRKQYESTYALRLLKWVASTVIILI